MISVTGVRKKFGRQQVLDGIDLEIGSGEMFGLLGPSGAGKTTLIRIVIGAETRDEGTVLVDGRPVPDFRSLQELGFMPQNDALYAEITGRDNLAFFGGLHGLRGKDLDLAIMAALDLVDLGPDARKLVSAYSGGMKKRLSLAAALIHDPAILILDEPTVGIDPLLRRKIWDELARLRSAGKTLVVTTHVMDEIKYCDRAGLISGGKLIACDTVASLTALGGGDVENLFFDPSLARKGA